MKDRHDYGNYIRSLDTLLPVLTAASVMPTYLRTPFFLGGAVVPGIFKALKSVKAIEIAAEQCVQQRQYLVSNGIAGEKNDILADLFDISTNKGEKVDFGLTEIKVEVYVALFAGSDTTAAAISSILYHLVKNPAAYHKLNAEIREAIERGELSHSSVQYREAQQLPYLDACCKEGMRVHPSVGLTLPRHVPKGGCQIAGEWFPEGTRVGVNAAVIHFNKEIFGHDAEEFNPDRWFREGAANMDRYMFQWEQFGGGSRTCIGKNISLCEMYKLVPQLLLSFDLEDMGTEWTTHNYCGALGPSVNLADITLAPEGDLAECHSEFRIGLLPVTILRVFISRLPLVLTWKGVEVEMSPVLPVSARADRAIAKLHRAIHSRNGLDVTLLFTGEVARLLTVVLVLVHKSTQGAQQSRLPGGALKYALSKVPGTWGLGKAFASCSGQASTRMRALSDILEEWQMMHRLCGLLDVWASVKELVGRSTTDAQKEPTHRLKIWIEVLQSLCLTSFHVCEATALLSSKRFLAWSEPVQERLSYLSIRSWAAFTFLDLARLLLDKPKLDASESKLHDDRNIAWRKEFLRTLAWAPVTVHWGLRGGLLPEIIASLLAVYATSGLMEEVWQDIA
ncbi:hypothetical protein FDECE_5071 [Fusarium decemcellulare]|nr:hypothetical protein FDECE_5071 [Fusarium decemcellulare]